MNLNFEKLMHTMGPLYLFEGTQIPLHYNAQGLSKSVDFETGLFLSNLVQYHKPKTIVELGTFRGYSTAWLIAGNDLAAGSEGQAGHVHAYEVFKEGAYGSMWYDDLEMQLDHFTYHEVPGGVWRFMDQVPETIDFMFHDTQHLLGPTIHEMNYLLPRVPKGGVIVFDDMCYPDYKEMQHYLDEFFTARVLDGRWSWQILRIGHGLGIAQRLA